jgi:hypothetical protein
MEQMEFTREIMEALGAAFPNDEIEFLPRAQSNGKALGLAYIDARSVMRRLDAAVGPGNWSFDFDLLDTAGKMVKGKLTVLGVTKCDAGEAAQEDEPLKSAVSDALKRCAVHFGIGRYLYYLPRAWAPYDAQKRRFIEPPRLEPRAVEEALRICGISQVETRSPSRGQATAAAAVRRAERAPKSIWVAGAEAAPEGEIPALVPAAPESSGDRAVAQKRPNTQKPGQARLVADTTLPAAGLECSGPDCGKPLTKGQHDVSMRAYGQSLCPACQKQAARVGS